MRWNEFSKEEDDRFWTGISGHYSKYQMRVLKALSRRGLAPYHMVPQWFLGQPPIKGTTNIPAPALDTATRAKIEALYHFSKSGQGISHGAASVYASVFLYDAIFPEETRRGLPPPQDIYDFDPRVNDLEPVMDAMSKIDTRQRTLSRDYSTLNCVRIATNRR